METEPQKQVARARKDLAQRLGLDENEVAADSVTPADFPDAALGAPVEDEMSAQVITPGWRIRLQANKEAFEYRTDKNQLRLVNFKGENYKV
jgi:hypothetical protein